jgi:hypothetical protein
MFYEHISYGAKGDITYKCEFNPDPPQAEKDLCYGFTIARLSITVILNPSALLRVNSEKNLDTLDSSPPSPCSGFSE